MPCLMIGRVDLWHENKVIEQLQNLTPEKMLNLAFLKNMWKYEYSWWKKLGGDTWLLCIFLWEVCVLLVWSVKSWYLHTTRMMRVDEPELKGCRLCGFMIICIGITWTPQSLLCNQYSKPSFPKHTMIARFWWQVLTRGVYPIQKSQTCENSEEKVKNNFLWENSWGNFASC